MVVVGSILDVGFIVASWGATFGIQWDSVQFLFYVLILFVVIVKYSKWSAGSLVIAIIKAIHRLVINSSIV